MDKLNLSDTRIGAVVQLPNDMERILKYAVSAGDGFNLLTTVSGAESLGLHAAKYTELFAREPIGNSLPMGSGLEVISLEQQKHDIFVRNAEQYVSMGLLIMLMSLLGFAAYFNGIGMKIRLKEYQISVMRAIGSPIKKLRRKMAVSSIEIPVIAAAISYGLIRLMEFFHTLRQDLNKTVINIGFAGAALIGFCVVAIKKFIIQYITVVRNGHDFSIRTFCLASLWYSENSESFMSFSPISILKYLASFTKL